VHELLGVVSRVCTPKEPMQLLSNRREIIGNQQINRSSHKHMGCVQLKPVAPMIQHRTSQYGTCPCAKPLRPRRKRPLLPALPSAAAAMALPANTLLRHWTMN
jgi:hypothetical protein